MLMFWWWCGEKNKNSQVNTYIHHIDGVSYILSCCAKDTQQQHKEITCTSLKIGHRKKNTGVRIRKTFFLKRKLHFPCEGDDDGSTANKQFTVRLRCRVQRISNYLMSIGGRVVYTKPIIRFYACRCDDQMRFNFILIKIHHSGYLHICIFDRIFLLSLWHIEKTNLRRGLKIKKGHN